MHIPKIFSCYKRIMFLTNLYADFSKSPWLFLYFCMLLKHIENVSTHLSFKKLFTSKYRVNPIFEGS